MENTRRRLVHRVQPKVSREATGGEERDERFKELDRLNQQEDDLQRRPEPARSSFSYPEPGDRAEQILVLSEVNPPFGGPIAVR